MNDNERSICDAIESPGPRAPSPRRRPGHGGRDPCSRARRAGAPSARRTGPGPWGRAARLPRVELPLASALAVAYLAWAVQTILMVH